MSYEDQLMRIENKLKIVKTKDADLTIFGSRSHRYESKAPISTEELGAFENRNGIEIPEPFKLFLTNIGNGGAGPYYGIYSLEKNDVSSYLSKPCQLHPAMTEEEWQALIRFDHDDVSDEEYDAGFDALYQGMLRIGTQGCTYNMMLILNGEHKGRVVYTEDDLQKPFFTYEMHFLDWYERWLNEIINDYNLEWFGMRRGGDDGELVRLFQNNDDEKVQASAITGMLKLPAITPETAVFLEELSHHGKTAELRQIAVQVLAKCKFSHAKPILEQMLASTMEAEQLSALQLLHWYAEDELGSFAEQLKALLPQVTQSENFRFIGYLLNKLAVDPALFIPFFYHEDKDIRKQAIYEVGKADHKERFLEPFIYKLQDEELSVKHITVQALGGITRIELLPYYQQILRDYDRDEQYILSNVMHRLREFGKEALPLLQEAARHSDKEARRMAREILQQLEG